ncbi:MAG: hypothetical protein QOJ60_2246 [Actinomycetota bacterium]|jgi:hypothetical protein|nr:hypothetical protein [Actinomycetota bacterium]
MTLEGSLDAFSLPDIFQLLSFTKKTGALRIQSPSAAGLVYFSTGSVTGGTSDTSRQSLGRRVVGKGLVADDVLQQAVNAVRMDGSAGLARVLRDSGSIDESQLHEIAIEQATDAVFDLLRWTEGDFAFETDESNPDDLGIHLGVEDIIAEGRRRLETWDALSSVVPSSDVIVSIPLAASDHETVLSPAEWTLLALVDGQRSVADLVDLTGRGEFAIVSAVVSLVERGLLVVGEQSADDDAGLAALLRRQRMLSDLEGRAEPAPAQPLAVVPASPEVQHFAQEAAAQPESTVVRTDKPFQAPQRSAVPTNAAHAPEPRSAAVAAGAVPQVVPTRPDHLMNRKPDFPEGPIPGVRQPSSAGAHQTIGATAVATDPSTAPSAGALIERDPSVNKSLLLRLIAGVRGL